MSLTLFPVRVPIGKTSSTDGRQLDVLMTPEFARALADILVRIGGPDGISNTDLQKLVKALQGQAVQLANQIAALSEITEDLDKAIQVLDDMYLQLEITSSVPLVAQSLSDIALMMAMPDKTPALQKNTVTGAKGGNAALTSLLVALAKSGIITDSTT